MIETVLSSPAYVAVARQSGVYGEVLAWLSGYRRGAATQFPYRTAPPQSDRIQHDSPQWNSPTEDRPRWEQWQTQRPTFYQPAPSLPQRTPPSTYTAATPAIAAAASGAIILSPAAKALDYFQEALEMLGIHEEEGLTHDRLKTAYKRAARAAHPDKGGTKEQFDDLRRAYEYVGKILDRVNPRVSASEKARMSAPVTMESAKAARIAVEDKGPVILSSKKLDMSTFNKLFEENRLPDPERETGYGDWMKGQGGGDEPVMDSRLQGKFNLNTFEQVFREKAGKQPKSEALMKRLEPDALIAPGGVELGASSDNFTAAFGSDTQFTDLKQAYTTGATMFQDVADVRVQERSARSVEDAQRIRAAEMARVDPTESARIAAAAAALEERERQRRLRLAQADVASEAWSDQMRRRLMVRNG